MNFRKSVLIISLLLILSVSIGMVSASSDIAIEDIDSEDVSAVAVDQVDNNGDISVLGEEQTFSGIQALIDGSNDGDIIGLNGVYRGNGSKIKVNKSITINGNGATLDARGLSGIFYVTASDVTINNINFINGNVSDWGGAILNDGSNLTIINCSFVNNSAWCGGAIYWSSLVDEGNIIGCGFKNNYASEAGSAIYWGDMSEDGSLINCNFENNRANSEMSAGSAVFWAGVNGSIIGCNFTNNKGGAICLDNYAIDCTVRDSNFVNNTDMYGAAISWGGANGVVNNCSFINNKASPYYADIDASGGAIFWSGTNGSIIGCNFVNNNVYADYNIGNIRGGAIFCSATSSISIKNCNFVNNSASFGTIYDTDYGSAYGGAICLNTHKASVIACTFKGNSAIKGSSIYILSGCNVINNTFTNIPYYKSIDTIVNLIPENTLKANGNKFSFAGKGTLVFTPYKLSTTYNSLSSFKIIVTDKNGKRVADTKLALRVYTGKKYKTYYVNTGYSGIAYFKLASNLTIGTHKVIVSTASPYVTAKAKTSYIVVKKALTTVVAPKVTNKYRKSAYFKARVTVRVTGHAIPNLILKFKVYTGKKYKTYTVKTKYNEIHYLNGIASLNTKSLSRGTHKVVITGYSKYYTVNKTSYIVIK